VLHRRRFGGNNHPTLSYHLKDDWRIGHASADTQRDWGNGSRLYEVNIWMWRYGRGHPRMLSIAQAERITGRAERLSESRIRAAEKRKRRSEIVAAAGAARGGGGSD
jgi:hypothetical protein